MIPSLLIANRGEIAVRIMRSCARLGIRTIAVYSDADREAPHVRLADEAVRIGPAPARESYLRAEAIMEAAARAGAAAIHPGYGFLSEKPELPRLCAAAGLVWVGPSAECIAMMGDKIRAKRIAAEAGVKSVPGYAGDEQSTARLREEARRVGFPLMVKASAGGGGRGMRRVHAPEELDAALDIARREAEAAFGDPALLIERLVLRPRHLEVQVAGDKHGNLVHLFERDCSVQRNNQKVLEEAPAPNLPPAARAALLGNAVKLSRAIGYDNLGTVEFIFEDGQDEPWFLEMNTRLQVEHPVTEAITGQDLVEWQIRIASGEALPLRQEMIQARGHAIEARITAERAEQGFRPDAGVVMAYRAPETIRFDSGIAPGSEVTLFYDSLLAKAIAHGETRAEALARLKEGLRHTVILGPRTTLAFLASALDQPDFANGLATTRFIEEAFPEGWQPPATHLALARAIAAVLAATAPQASMPASAWGAPALAGFRVLAPAGAGAAAHVLVSDEDEAAELAVTLPRPGVYRVAGKAGAIELRLRRQGEAFEAEHEGRVIPGWHAQAGEAIYLQLAGETHGVSISTPARAAASGGGKGGAASGAVLAPMPGVIAEIKAGPGERVEAGQTILVLESMKLFTSLSAPVSGLVEEIFCRAGETVAAGARLMVIEPDAASPT
ncbi:biotin carboxylase N-terminal domain-containing protein [Acidocella sp.]|uniref:ATP-binding protein n=1 Tax=Acidocella sp. TaxID=50710 RepID=UPI00260FDEA5|nr:biotin carboxylase N-terminal domain-containing protein [Acidocella sp.]